MSACSDSGFAVEIDIAFANSDIISVSDFMSKEDYNIFPVFSRFGKTYQFPEKCREGIPPAWTHQA
jgi:hypothetical protein